MPSHPASTSAALIPPVRSSPKVKKCHPATEKVKSITKDLIDNVEPAKAMIALWQVECPMSVLKACGTVKVLEKYAQQNRFKRPVRELLDKFAPKQTAPAPTTPKAEKKSKKIPRRQTWPAICFACYHFSPTRTSTPKKGIRSPPPVSRKCTCSKTGVF